MANPSLPQDKPTEFRPISVSAAAVLARLAAKKAVQEQLRAEGVRVSLVKPAEISVKAHAYLQSHPELYVEAKDRALRLGLFEKRRRVAANRPLLFNVSHARKSEQQMTTIGYARVSTDGQSLQSQTEALHLAGCGRIYSEKMSGAYTDRPQLAKAIQALGNGDTLVVVKLDRLARSTRDLLNTLDAIGKAGASFKSLSDQWADTTTPHGRLMLTVLGGLAEFERHLILTRTSEGRARARADRKS